MKIIRVEVIINMPGADQVYLKTNLPYAFPKLPEAEQNTMRLQFEAEKGTGIDYVFENFRKCNIVNVIDYRTGEVLKHRRSEYCSGELAKELGRKPKTKKWDKRTFEEVMR